MCLPNRGSSTALCAGRFGDARALIDKRLSDANAPQCPVTSTLENLGLSLAHAGHHDDSIAAFERALDLGWNVVPDGRCEIARVLLLAGRSADADVLWRRLRDADPDGVWTLNAGRLAYVDTAAARAAMKPALWLLEHATNGNALTQTGALNRALVREVALRWRS